jgi:hypothetical protein
MGIGRFIANFKSTNNEKYDIETADRIYKFRNLDDYDLNQRITYLRDFEAEKEYNRRKTEQWEKLDKLKEK